jgi:hypothetical protein
MDWFWEIEGTAKMYDNRVNKWVYFPYYLYSRWTANIRVLLGLTQDLFGQHGANLAVHVDTVTEQLDYQIPNTLGFPGSYPTPGTATSITRTQPAFAFSSFANTDPDDNQSTVLDCNPGFNRGLIRSMKWLIKNPWLYAGTAGGFFAIPGPIYPNPVIWAGDGWSGPGGLLEFDCLTRPPGPDIVEMLQAELVHVP